MEYFSSADETGDKRDSHSHKESKGGRFGGEFKDDEPQKRQEKEFRFDAAEAKVASKPASSKPVKKIDLGAAAFYKGDPLTTSASIFNHIHAAPANCTYFLLTGYDSSPRFKSGEHERI